MAGSRQSLIRCRGLLTGVYGGRRPGVISEVLTRFVNHHVTPLNITAFEVLEKVVLVAKHLITSSCLLPRSLLFDACGSVSFQNASSLRNDISVKVIF